MSDIVDQSKVTEVAFGTPIEITDDATMTVTTVNKTLGVVETDAFEFLSVTLVDRAATELLLKDIETGARFKVTYEYLGEDEENNDGK